MTTPHLLQVLATDVVTLADDPRVQAWVRACYKYYKRCYHDSEPDRLGQHFYFSRLDSHKPGLVTPENHFAAYRIRQFYPAHAANLTLTERPPADEGTDWWKLYATPES